MTAIASATSTHPIQTRRRRPARDGAWTEGALAPRNGTGSTVRPVASSRAHCGTRPVGERGTSSGRFFATSLSPVRSGQSGDDANPGPSPAQAHKPAAGVRSRGGRVHGPEQ